MTERPDGTMSTETERPTRSTRATWLLIGGTSLISIGLAAFEIAPASVTPLIQDSLQVSGADAGFLVGIMFGTAVIASLPIGALLDRTDSRTEMAIAVLALFVAGGWGWVAAWKGEYLSIVAARALGGIAYVVVWNAGIDIVSQSVRETHRATAIGVFTASGPIGFALGQGASPAVAARFGWPAIFLVFNSLALLGLAVFWPTSRGLGRRVGAAPTLDEFTSVLRNRGIWLVGGLGFLGYALYLFMNSWGASYLTEEVGISLGLSGLLIAVFPAVGVLSRASSGFLSDYLFGGRRRPVVLGSFFIAAPLILIFTQLHSIFILVTILLVTGFAIQLTLGLSFTYARELVDQRVGATAVAFQSTVGFTGAFLAPIVGGAIIDGAGYETAFLVAGSLAVCGVVLAWSAPRTRAEKS